MLEFLLFILVLILLPSVIRYIRKARYFGSDEFRARKAEIASVVAEHNDVTNYVAEIRAKGSYDLGASSTGAYAHLATFENTSRYNYKRDRNVATYQAPHVHNCSLQVVRNASSDPIKYLMKYFNVKPDEPTLAQVEEMGSSIAQLEEAVQNLRDREATITRSIDPPKFIKKHYMNEFMEQMGVKLSPISVPYPIYQFEYVSAGGNSGQKTTINLNTPTIDALVETLSQKIRWRKSVAGQRALMTTKLRNFIKERDGHSCQQCSVSVAVEPHLLLEVDHILPVSRGGLTTPENLQALCWRCNRAKSKSSSTAEPRAVSAEWPENGLSVGFLPATALALLPRREQRSVTDHAPSEPVASGTWRKAMVEGGRCSNGDCVSLLPRLHNPTWSTP